jgi:hypothetical protein
MAVNRRKTGELSMELLSAADSESVNESLSLFLFLFLPCNCLLHHVEDYAMNFWTAHFSRTNQVCGIMI